MDSMLALPDNTVMTTGPDRERKPHKMRASCDACSRAKVKCDKIRPTCHRCGNIGICCNYSPSMRLGKPRKNRNPDGSILRAVSPANNCRLPGPRLDIIPRTTSQTAESSPEPSDPSFFGPATPEYHYQDAFMSHGYEGSQSPGYSEAGSMVSGWSNDDHLMFGTPTDIFSPFPAYTTPHNPFGRMRTTSAQSQLDMFVPIDPLSSPPMASPPLFSLQDVVFSQDKLMASPSPVLPAPLLTPTALTTPTTRQNHDCTQFAFQILNSLYAPPATQPSVGDFNGSFRRLPTLDAVLATSQAAVDKLYLLLTCLCSTNPHFSTTIAFTITKILSWFQAIAGASQEGIDTSGNTQMEAFTHNPISLGDSRLESEDEDTFRTKLILGELRRVEKLIDKLSERYCKAANPAETGIDGGVYGALESLLRTRVRDTFKITMNTAPQEVKRQVASRSHNRARVNTL